MGFSIRGLGFIAIHSCLLGVFSWEGNLVHFLMVFCPGMENGAFNNRGGKVAMEWRMRRVIGIFLILLQLWHESKARIGSPEI